MMDLKNAEGCILELYLDHHDDGITKSWTIEGTGIFHRMLGPAIEYADGGKGYYIAGKAYSKRDFLKEIKQTWYHKLLRKIGVIK